LFGSPSPRRRGEATIADWSRFNHASIVFIDRGRAQIQRRLAQLREATGVDPLGAAVARAGTCQLFLIPPGTCLA
jgi:hypothetical protein